jgi:hypothetical protein
MIPATDRVHVEKLAGKLETLIEPSRHHCIEAAIALRALSAERDALRKALEYERECLRANNEEYDRLTSSLLKDKLNEPG